MRNRKAHALITGLVLAAAVLLRIADPEPVARLRLSVFDTFQRLAPRTVDPSFPVRVVDIDDASLAAHGQWPWPRATLARLVDTLGQLGARTITLDLLLAEPDRLSPSGLAQALAGTPEGREMAERLSRLPSGDDALARALAGRASVTGIAGVSPARGTLPPPKAAFAAAGDEAGPYVPAFPGGIGVIDQIATAVHGLGAVNWIPESDQIVRRVPLLVRIGDRLYPSLSLEALRVGAGDPSILVKASGASGLSAFGARSGLESVRTAGRILPTNERGEMWLKLAPPDTARTISAARVLGGRAEASEIRGRDILVGTSATGLLDVRATALSPAMPGVEIHAQALEQMLSGDMAVRPSYATGLELVFLVLVGLAVGWIMAASGPVMALALAAAAVAAVAAQAWFAYRTGGLLIDPVYPALALAAVYGAGSLHRYIVAERERAEIRRAFSHYMAPEIVEALAADPGRLALGGENREVSILFADVRGFSRLSEGMKAESLVSFMNRLFTPLTAAVHGQRGTIDKFMGDAVMAYWNAPLDEPAHARRACLSALDMISAIEAINSATSEASQIRIGIGLNTGDCCAGNVGSPQRFDYSIIGEAVNVAARLEEATKTAGLPILAGEATRRAADGLAFAELGTMTLRGKDRPERVYALLGDETVARDHRFEELAAAVTASAAAFRQGTAASGVAGLPAGLAIPDGAAAVIAHARRAAPPVSRV